MAKDYQKMGKEIVAKLGGEMNVTKLFHCATRLRFELKNKEGADLDAVKGIAGVMGVVESVGGVQVIIGNDVAKAYEAIMSGSDIGTGNSADTAKKELQTEKQNPVSRLLNVLSAIIGPAIPLIMCSGLVSALLIILAKFGLSAESTTYQLIQMVGSGALYLLPILLAYSSARKFGCNIMISLFLGGAHAFSDAFGACTGGDGCHTVRHSCKGGGLQFNADPCCIDYMGIFLCGETCGKDYSGCGKICIPSPCEYYSYGSDHALCYRPHRQLLRRFAV